MRGPAHGDSRRDPELSLPVGRSMIPQSTGPRRAHAVFGHSPFQVLEADASGGLGQVTRGHGAQVSSQRTSDGQAAGSPRQVAHGPRTRPPGSPTPHRDTRQLGRTPIIVLTPVFPVVSQVTSCNHPRGSPPSHTSKAPRLLPLHPGNSRSKSGAPGLMWGQGPNPRRSS